MIFISFEYSGTGNNSVSEGAIRNFPIVQPN